MKKINGITLIALVITIIVLLILAGVALATLTGQGNIIGNAENAVGKYNEEVSTEQKTLNAIEKFFMEKTDTNNPIVTAKQESLTIIAGEKYEVSDYFEINQNGASNITNITYSIEDTSTLTAGEHILTCRVTKENGKSSSASMTIIVKLSYTEEKWTTAGTYSWTCPEGVTKIRVAVCGGGRRWRGSCTKLQSKLFLYRKNRWNIFIWRFNTSNRRNRRICKQKWDILWRNRGKPKRKKWNTKKWIWT